MIPYLDFLSNLPLRPTVVAHRGAWRLGPENSIPAVLAAAELGCEIAEIDVQLSADGHLFLLHDDDLLRMTGRSATAQDLPITQIVTSALRQGNGGDGSTPSDVMLPSFAKLLEAARERIYLDVDVKHDRNLAAAASAIAASGMAGQAAIKISVRNVQEAERLRQLQDEHGLMVMPKTAFTEANADAMITLLAGLGSRVCEAEFDRLETLARRRDAFARAGVAIWINTLDGAHCDGLTDSAAMEDADGIWGALREAGASIIQTDQPEALLKWRAKLPKDGQ